ncbi:MAG: O-antigen ligase family protein [Flavobacteriales bacterium]|nr:O-antigen ligase family protein [Flavobacteriales bacterium]
MNEKSPSGYLSHRNVHFFGLVLLAVGLPFSLFLISLSQIILLANWMVAGNWRHIKGRFFGDPLALIMVSVYVAYVIGLIHTQDFPYAWEDLRIKLPLLILPLIIATTDPLTETEFIRILRMFVAAVFTATLVSVVVKANLTPISVVDNRDISIFISHIRFSLMVCLAVFFLAWMHIRDRASRRWVYMILMAYFLWFLFLLKAMTGIVIAGVVGWLMLLLHVQNNRTLAGRRIYLFLLYLLPVIPALLIANIVRNYNLRIKSRIPLKMEVLTPYGNRYVHQPHDPTTESGYLVYRHVAWEELKEAWEERSGIGIDGSDKKGNRLSNTLIRFLTSKGLKKDRDGLMALSDDEIRAIENGIANARYMEADMITARVEQICWELDRYRSTGNPGGHSVSLRLEIWRTAGYIIAGHPWFGVGTGDVDVAFKEAYDLMDSPLSPQWRLSRSHNQFISVAVSICVFGLLVFVFSLCYPWISGRIPHPALYLSFFTIVLISMINEDTLENQVGLTFFAFFNSLLLFGRGDRRASKSSGTLPASV